MPGIHLSDGSNTIGAILNRVVALDVKSGYPSSSKTLTHHNDGSLREEMDYPFCTSNAKSRLSYSKYSTHTLEYTSLFVDSHVF